MKKIIKSLFFVLICLFLFMYEKNPVYASEKTNIYYKEDFEYIDAVGQQYKPEDLITIDHPDRLGKGNLTIQEENGRYYFSIDELENGPKYIGKIWPEEVSEHVGLEFDFRLREIKGKDIKIFSYENKLNAGKLAIRGKINANGDVYFHNGNTEMKICNLIEEEWVHFKYEINNATKTYELQITSIDTGEILGIAENFGFHKKEAVRAGAFSFNIEEAAWFDIDEILLYDLEKNDSGSEDNGAGGEGDGVEVPDGTYKIYYEENFQYENLLGQNYMPKQWRTAGSIGDGIGQFTIAEEEANYYYSMDARTGNPKYLGYVLNDVSKKATLEYDFRLNQMCESQPIELLSYDTGVNGRKLAIRGGINPDGKLFFYDFNRKNEICSIANSRWVHIKYEVNNKDCTYKVFVTDKETGEEIGKTESNYGYYQSSAQVGAFSFQIKESAWIDVDNIKVHGYESPFVFEPEIPPLEQDGKVYITKEGDVFSIKNDYCKVNINEKNAVIEQFYTKEGNEICGSNGNGYYLIDYKDSQFSGSGKPASAFKDGVGTIVKQTEEMCELSVKSVAMAGLPIDIDFRYVMKYDTPGLYMYAIVEQTENADPNRKFAIEQSRYSIKFDFKSFPYGCVEDGIMKKMAGPGDFEEMDQLFDSTYVMKDGNIYTKYNNLTYQYDHYVCGAYSDEGGISLITPSRDWAGGGYTKQDIDVHGGKSNTFIVNWHLGTNHMGTEPTKVEQDFQKVYGPVLWYPDTASDSKEEAWNKAWKQAQEEIAKWPYSWVEEERYAAEKRAAVKGRFTVKNGVIDTTVKNDLTVGESIGWAVLSDMRSTSWQKDNTYYEFYAPIQKDGTFAIEDIIPGTYRLNINVNGIIGEYTKANIVINERDTVDMGNLEWEVPYYGKTLWSIGIPDRTSEEYAYGKPYRYWGAHILFNTLFPNGVDYKVGESDYTKDWFFLHTASQTAGRKEHYDGAFYYDEILKEVRYDGSRANAMTENDSRWKGNELAEYKIRFDSENTYAQGTGTLVIAIAGGRSSTLKVSLNGKNISDTIQLSGSGSVGRCSGNDIYEVQTIPFDAKLLKEGENVFVLTHDHPAYAEDNQTAWENSDYTIYAGTMYDAIRLDLNATAESEKNEQNTSGSEEDNITGDADSNVSVNTGDNISVAWIWLAFCCMGCFGFILYLLRNRRRY